MTYIDLGLSVLWASHNIGAESEQEKGEPYSYGETETKDNFSFESYQYGKTVVDLIYDVPPMFQDYASPKEERFPHYDDIGNILGTIMDVAHKHYGDLVRMPSKEDVEELLEKCIQQPVESGVRFIGPNNNSIFMPYGNYWTGILSSCQGEGFYNIYDTTHHYAYSLIIDANGAQLGMDSREKGLMIRPVSVNLSTTSIPTTGLIGAICGDIIGLPYEFRGTRTKNYHFPLKFNDFSDDTILSIAIADWLMGEHTEKLLRQKLLDYAIRFKEKNVWGRGFQAWFESGGTIDRKGVASNGAAMRVTAIGLAADSLDEVLRLAELSARITHDSDEAARGAQAAAAAVYMNRFGFSKDEVRRYIEETFHYDLSRTVEDIRKDYQFEILCDRCVPESIICWLQSDSYEQAVRNAVSLGGDADTMAAIAGGIAAATPDTAVPEELALPCFNLLPDDFKAAVLHFHLYYEKV